MGTTTLVQQTGISTLSDFNNATTNTNAISVAKSVTADGVTYEQIKAVIIDLGNALLMSTEGGSSVKSLNRCFTPVLGAVCTEGISNAGILFDRLTDNIDTMIGRMNNERHDFDRRDSRNFAEAFESDMLSARDGAFIKAILSGSEWTVEVRSSENKVDDCIQGAIPFIRSVRLSNTLNPDDLLQHCFCIEIKGSLSLANTLVEQLSDSLERHSAANIHVV